MTTFAVLPLAAIRPNPRNIRRQLGDPERLAELTQSIRETGLIEPLIVAPGTIGKPKATCPDCDRAAEIQADGILLEHQAEDGTCPGGGRYASDLFELVAGHRRHHCCTEAGLAEVPCIIREDLTKPGPQIINMWSENRHREDLSPIEEASAAEQLELLGYKPAQIAKETGISKTTVDRRLALLKLPEPVRDKVHAHQVTLADAEAMVEFAGDTKAMKALEAAAGGGNFRWKLEEIRRARHDKAAAAKAKSKLIADGVPVIKAPSGWPWSHDTEKLRRLGLYVGHVNMTPAEHVSCPGHVAIAPTSGDVQYACTQPSEHAAKPGGPQLSKAEQKRLAAEEKRQAKEREDLQTAAALRRDWFTGWMRDTAPDAADAAEVLRTVALLAATGYIEAEPDRWLACLGVTQPPDLDAGDVVDWQERELLQQATLAGGLTAVRHSPLKLVVAMLASLLDEGLTNPRVGKWSGGWQRENLAWLALLEHLGYSPSKAEQAKCAEAVAALAQEANTEQAEDQEVPA